MSFVRDIITSDFFVLAIIPLTIIVGVLYLCKVYNFSLIPKSLRKRKKKKRFTVPNITRTQIDKNLGHAGKYMWVVYDSVSNEESSLSQVSTKQYGILPSNESNKPFYFTEARVVPKPLYKGLQKNMYN
jgi:hypothetical protein